MAISSFKNLIAHEIIDNEYKSTEVNVNDLLMEESNSFLGWECWAGIQNITIDNQGNVWRAICRQGKSLGSIHSEFSFPEDTVVCQKKRCNCAADIQLSKRHPAHRGIIRVDHQK